MPIIVINGPDKSANSLLANSLRNTAISSGNGALLINDNLDGDAVHHLEKIIAADPFVKGTDAEKVKWKKDPAIILVGSGEKRLAEFEKICPGFTKKFGPVSKMGGA